MTSFKTILFDLDGTLVDTAPDLAYALNLLLKKNHRPTLPYEIIRPQAGHGGKGLIKLGFNIDERHPEYIALWQELLNVYSLNICRESRLFAGMQTTLDFLSKNHLRWGIVTNKPGWLTEPLLLKLNLMSQVSCVVSGDTLAKRKPDPEPILHACQLMNCSVTDSLYIGDAERDIQAAKSAGMRTVLALYGYLAETDQPESWGADCSVQKPEEIIEKIKDSSLQFRKHL